MIKAIIFDWGGVLAPSDSRIAAVRLSKNFSLDQEEFIAYFDDHEDDLCHTNAYEDFMRTASQRFKIPQKTIIAALNADPPDEEFAIAKTLSKDYKMYILSNQLKYRTDYIKKTFDLSFFDKVFFSNEIGLKKPSAEIFDFLLEEIKQKPEACLFIDDSPINVAVARKKGINCIQFKSLEQCKRDLLQFSIDVH